MTTVTIKFRFSFFCLSHRLGGYIGGLRKLWVWRPTSKFFKMHICSRGIKWNTFWPWPISNQNLPYLCPALGVYPIFFNSIQFNLYFHKNIYIQQETTKYYRNKIRRKRLEGQWGLKIVFPWKQKKNVTKHPNSYNQNQNKTRRQTERLH